MKRKLFVLAMCTMIAVAFLSGCGKKEAREEAKSNQNIEIEEETAKENIEQKNEEVIEETVKEEVVQDEPQNTIHVKSAKELLAAIGSDVNIVLDKGTYNLSGVIRNAANVTSNPNLELLVASYDNEVAVSGVRNLSITGPLDGKAEILVEDPYSAVMVFKECENITLSNVTMGHTVEKGHCSGAVLRFDDCTNINLGNDDLYGCGTYGVECYRTQGMRIDDCIIRECTYGIVSMYLCSDVQFNNCVMKDCEQLDLIYVNYSSAVFNNCEFKGNQTRYDFVSKDANSVAVFNGCSFGELETERINEQNGGSTTCIFDEKCVFAGNNLKSVVTVSSAKELLDAIRPGATIYIKPGEYNLSECASSIYEERGVVWNNTHQYVKFQEVFDGIEITLNNVNDLTIYGLGQSREDTTLLIDPRYAAIFSLQKCNNVSFMNITAGHTDRGNCVGNVIDIYGGKGFIFDNVDFFGCGVYGIGAYDSCRDINVYDSIIHDCEYGPFEIEDAVGEINIVNTELTGSNGGGYCGPGEYNMCLLKCTFGENESNKFFFIESPNIEISQCSFAEITSYPDYEYSDYEFDNYEFVDEETN